MSNLKHSRSRRKEGKEEKKIDRHEQQLLIAPYRSAITRPIELTVAQFFDMYSKVCSTQCRRLSQS